MNENDLRIELDYLNWNKCQLFLLVRIICFSEVVFSFIERYSYSSKTYHAFFVLWMLLVVLFLVPSYSSSGIVHFYSFESMWKYLLVLYSLRLIMYQSYFKKKFISILLDNFYHVRYFFWYRTKTRWNTFSSLNLTCRNFFIIKGCTSY